MNRFEYINDEYDEEFCHILDNETEEEYNDLEIITNLLNNFEKELEVYKRALELACERIKNMYEQEQQYCTNEIENFTQVEFAYFTAYARKELEEKDE